MMTSTLPTFALTGKTVVASADSFVSTCSGEGRDANPFERLVQITRSNDRLVSDLATARRRVVQALAYAEDSLSRAELGVALVAHARRKHRRLLDQLRANRSEAVAILAGAAVPR